MPIVHLNDRKVAGLPPAAGVVEYFDRGFPAFAVRVFPSGVKSFILFYRQGGKLRRMTLGRYPEMTLATARGKARNALTAVSEGHDPAQQRLTAKARTFTALATLYLDKHAKARKRSWRDDQRMITRELAAWDHRTVTSLRRSDVRELLDGIVARGAPVAANRVLALIRKMFNVALDQEWLEVNPAQRVRPPGAERARDRVLADDEIRALWTFLHTDIEDADPQVVRYVRLTRATFALRLITAQRGIEIANMRRADIQGDWWTIPAEYAKNKLAHRVPLTALAHAELTRIAADTDKDSPFVFCGIRGTRQRRKALTDVPISDFQPRDLRRTAASNMTKAGVNRLVVSKVLNHVESGITAVYDRHSYDAEKRAALTTWDRRLTMIITPARPRRRKSVTSVLP